MKKILKIPIFIPHVLKTMALKLWLKTNLRDSARKPRALARVSFILIILFLFQNIVFAEKAFLYAQNADHLAPELNMDEGMLRGGFALLQKQYPSGDKDQSDLNYKAKLTEENYRILQEQIQHKNTLDQLARETKLLEQEHNRLELEVKDIIVQNKKAYAFLNEEYKSIDRKIRSTKRAVKKRAQAIERERVKKEYKPLVRGKAKWAKQMFRSLVKAIRKGFSYLRPLNPKEKELRILKQLLQTQENQREDMNKKIETLNSRTKQISLPLSDNMNKRSQISLRVKELESSIKALETAYERNFAELQKIQMKEFIISEQGNIKQEKKRPELLSLKESKARIKESLTSKFINRCFEGNLAGRLRKTSREVPLEKFAQVLAEELGVDPENSQIIGLIVKKIKKGRMVNLESLYSFFDSPSSVEPLVVDGYEVMLYKKIQKDISSDELLKKFNADVLKKIKQYVSAPDKSEYGYRNVLSGLFKLKTGSRRAIFRVVEDKKKIIFVTYKQRGTLGNGVQSKKILDSFTPKNLNEQILIKYSNPFMVTSVQWIVKDSAFIAPEAKPLISKRPVFPKKASVFVRQAI